MASGTYFDEGMGFFDEWSEAFEEALFHWWPAGKVAS